MDIFEKIVSGILIVATLFVLTIVIALPFIRFSSTHEGVHNGYITAIEQEGYIFPNYRVYVKTDNSSSQENVYCMDRSKTELAKKIKAYSATKQRVVVSFNGVRGLGADLCRSVEITNVVRE